MTSLETHLQAQGQDAEAFFWHKLRWRAVESVLGDCREVADIGAGAGLLGRYLARDCPEIRYTFEEPLASLEMDLVGRHGADANVRGRATLGADVVTLLDVLEHQEDDHAFLDGLLQRMRPGSRLVVTVPALAVLWSPWDVQLGHFRRYTRASLRSVLGASPVVLEEVNYLFPELVPAALARKALPRRAGATGGRAGEFPEVPAVVNGALLRLGSVTQSLRKWAPFGSSLIAVARRR